MKKLLSVLLFAIAMMQLTGQDLPVNQYYLLNPYLTNPAYAGITRQVEIRGTFAKQWIGLAGAPSTQTVSAQGGIGKGMGIGGYFYHDKNGLNSETGMNIGAAYHIQLGENDDMLKFRQLSFGLGVAGFQHSVNLSEFTEHDYDPAVDGAEKSAFAVDFNVGVLFRYDGLFAGVSSTGLMNRNLSIYDDVTEPNFPTYLFVNAGYLFSPTDQFLLEPSLMYKFNTFNRQQIDVNLKAIFMQVSDQQYWAGLSLRRNLDSGNAQMLDLIALLGMNYRGFLFSYAYDFGLTNLNTSNSGSHQLMVGLRIKSSKKHSIDCPIF
jgi:type IX secretion system PorP/SprF family membrane protein